AILGELEKAVRAYPRVSSEIAVVADPAGVTELCGTHEDILIPSSCLNSTVSGLVSRTFLRDDIIGEKDFHGAVYYGELKDSDLSYEFIETIEKNFTLERLSANSETVDDGVKGKETGKAGGSAGPEEKGIDEVRRLAAFFGVEDINFVKPGIGETTRVLLRRIPWKVLIDERYREDPELGHVVRLAEEKHVPVEYYSLVHYKCCGIIKKIADA
ncbi:MAG: cysteine protease StiP family protein, partial [Acetatifactor sp.]|nr:cysteine protease StiP family protein [Acetatifactor sp.]